MASRLLVREFVHVRTARPQCNSRAAPTFAVPPLVARGITRTAGGSSLSVGEATRSPSTHATAAHRESCIPGSPVINCARMKRIVRLVLTHPSLVRAAFSLRQRIAPVFTLHRFRDLEVGNAGHDPQLLRNNLSWLRANNCSLLSLTELLDRLAEGAPLKRGVAFTVDDGYADFARVAAPIFAEVDGCPVTVFPHHRFSS